VVDLGGGVRLAAVAEAEDLDVGEAGGQAEDAVGDEARGLGAALGDRLAAFADGGDVGLDRAFRGELEVEEELLVVPGDGDAEAAIGVAVDAELDEARGDRAEGLAAVVLAGVDPTQAHVVDPGVGGVRPGVQGEVEVGFAKIPLDPDDLDARTIFRVARGLGGGDEAEQEGEGGGGVHADATVTGDDEGG
jgi:hypothetical protein